MTEPESHCPFCKSPLHPGLVGGLCPRCSLDSVVKEDENSLESQPGVPEIEGIELQAEIGEGGFGIVYRAHQVGIIRRKVALKVLKPGVDTRQVLRRFEIERQALAHLEHPGIARFYEAGQTKEGYPYFTMELVEGAPIHEAVGGQSLKDVISLFLEVCECVAYAHDQGVMHRDLKPSNILITPAGAPKVIDFGLAKALDSEQAPGMTLYTGGESWLGTPGYAAPEQMQASEIELDERADVYSLGAILYHLLTGLNPDDAREMATPPKELPPPSEIALQKIVPSLDTISLHALSTDREDRYPSVRAMMADLRRHLNGDTLSVKTPKQPASNKPIFAAIILLVLIVGGIIASSSPPKAEENKSTGSVENDYSKFNFEELGFSKLDEDEDFMPPFNETRNFCWVRFRKPDGGEFILSHDSLHGSPTVTQFFVGGKFPNEPGVRVIPIDSDEDQKLVKLYVGLHEKIIGLERATQLYETPWNKLPKTEEGEYQRKLKTLYGSIIFFRNHRQEIEKRLPKRKS